MPRRRPFTAHLTATALAAVLTTASPAWAEDAKPEPTPHPLEKVGPAIEEEMQRLMGILEMFLRSIPTYEMPEIQENGDIIIRRKQPLDTPDAPPEKEPPAPDVSRT